MTTLIEALRSASAEDPLYISDIMRICGFASEVRAREKIAELRQNGEAVVSFQGSAGYWLASTEKEMQTFVSAYTSNALKRVSNGRKITEKWYRDQNYKMEV